MNQETVGAECPRLIHHATSRPDVILGRDLWTRTRG